jgi:hypothetical protein
MLPPGGLYGCNHMLTECFLRLFLYIDTIDGLFYQMQMMWKVLAIYQMHNLDHLIDLWSTRIFSKLNPMQRFQCDIRTPVSRTDKYIINYQAMKFHLKRLFESEIILKLDQIINMEIFQKSQGNVLWKRWCIRFNQYYGYLRSFQSC